MDRDRKTGQHEGAVSDGIERGVKIGSTNILGASG